MALPANGLERANRGLAPFLQPCHVGGKRSLHMARAEFHQCLADETKRLGAAWATEPSQAKPWPSKIARSVPSIAREYPLAAPASIGVNAGVAPLGPLAEPLAQALDLALQCT
jgi:hypothetical protein